MSLPPLPDWSKQDDLGGLVPSEIRESIRAYGEACAAAERYERNLTRHSLREARQKIDEQQAHIDRLMLEYCPNEMTAEQKETWAAHQVSVVGRLL